MLLTPSSFVIIHMLPGPYILLPLEKIPGFTSEQNYVLRDW